MERVPVRRKSYESNKNEAYASEHHKEIEKTLLYILRINQHGQIIYPGEGSVENRTGSSVRLLIDWFLYEKAPEGKPIDNEIFRNYLKTDLGIRKASDGVIKTSKSLKWLKRMYNKKQQKI